ELEAVRRQLPERPPAGLARRLEKRQRAAATAGPLGPHVQPPPAFLDEPDSFRGGFDAHVSNATSRSLTHLTMRRNIRTFPTVALGQFIVALGFAELSSHYPVAGSVFQWTKYLSNKTYSWFAGWIYLFAGILTVTSVCVTLPLALIPAFNNMGWHLALSHSN